MPRCHDRDRRFTQTKLFVLVLFATMIFLGSSAQGTTTLFVKGTFANASNQLTLDFVLPVSSAEMKFRTYQNGGGNAYPTQFIPAGGMDSIVDLYGPSGYITSNDDISSSLDSELRTTGFSGDASATVISPLAAGDYDLILRCFGSTLGNGTFALNAQSQAGAFSDQGFSVNGLTGTPGVSINLVQFGQQSSGVPPKLNVDSASDTLNPTQLQFFGNYELNLSAGSVSTTNLYDGALNAVWGGGGAGLINISGGSLYAQTQIWGADSGHNSVINHTGGSNTSAVANIGYSSANNSGAIYKLSGSGVFDTDNLQVGTLMSAAGTAQFLQSGGTAHADFITVGSTATTAESALYRLTGGTASMESYGNLSIIGGGVFELSGGTLELTTVNQIQVSTGGSFNWLSGTLRLNSLTLDSSAGVLGPTLTLGPGRTLEVLGTTTNNTVLTLAGGKLVTGTLAGPGGLVFSTGELHLTGAAGLTVDALGPLGAFVNLGSGRKLTVTNAATVAAGSVMTIDSAASLSAGSLSNAGEIYLNGPSAFAQAPLVTNTGLIRGEGRLVGGLNNLATGELRAESGKRVKVEGTYSTNAGKVNLQGGTAELSQALTNGSSGQITGRGTFITGGAGLTNNGHIALSSGITDVFGDVNNATGSASKGVIISGNADVTFWDDVTNGAGSLFKVSAGSSVTVFGTYSGAGISGNANDIHLEADISPGFSPATVDFGGNLHFSSTTTLHIELGGTTAGTQYDQVRVSEQLSLDGALLVTLINGFLPSAGQSFNILDWGTFTGAFSSISLPALTGGKTWNTSQLYIMGVLSISTPIVPGDFDSDGDVDGADFVIWQTNFPAANGHVLATGDADNDGDVDGADFVVWQTNFPYTPGPGAAPVPEPTAFILAIAAVTTMGCWRRRAL